MAIIPLTANTLGKMTCGICDNLLTSAYRAWGSKKPIIVAPCMNTEMFNHPLTSQQLEQIKKWGVEVIEPCEKLLACGDVGKGALPPVDEVVKRIRSILSSSVCQQTRLFLLSLLRTDQESRRSKRLQERRLHDHSLLPSLQSCKVCQSTHTCSGYSSSPPLQTPA